MIRWQLPKARAPPGATTEGDTHMSQLRGHLQAQPGGLLSRLFGAHHLPGASPSSVPRGQPQGEQVPGALPLVPLLMPLVMFGRSRPPLKEKQRRS